MKIMKVIYLVLITIVLLNGMGCKKQLDINKDPNNPDVEKATPVLLFPTAVMSTAGRVGGDMAILGGLWAEFWAQAAASNQYKNIEDYNLPKSQFNGAYTELFSGALNDYVVAIQKAKEANDWKFYLMATAMKVYTYQVLVDLYDKVPYTEAFQGGTNLQPKFDDGKSIYTALLKELDTALSKDYVSATLNAEQKSADLVFGGDINKWVRFTNTLKLKMYLRMVNADASTAEAGIKKLYTDGALFLETDDGGIKSFVDQPDNSNPMYEYNIRRLNTTTNLRGSNTLMSYLKLKSDPRLSSFYAGTVGMNQGDYNNTGATTASVVTQKATDPVYFISLAESKFMQAEARVRYYAGVGAKTLYDAGVTAAFAQWGKDATTFLTGGYAYPAAGTTAQQIEAIITQKWISCFGSHALEAFFERNRTGYPKTSPVYSDNDAYVPGQIVLAKNHVTQGKFPRRLVFPDVEASRNSNTPAEVPLTTPVWWALPNL